jgi:molybdopterin-binding protein
MNKLPGTIVAVESNRHMSLVDVLAEGDTFTATLLETPEHSPQLRVGQPVILMFKETEVSLAKDLAGQISLRNRFPVMVQSIERGDIMSAVGLNYREHSLMSVITTRAVERLQLAVGDRIEALVKANEMVLSYDER